MQNLAVVIPAFNEARTIRDVAARALNHCTTVVVVDDASTDGTAAAVADLPVRVVRQSVNAGKAAALRRGFDVAIEQGAEAVITLDADGQHRPEDIPQFVAAAREHPEAIAVGSRLADRASIPTKRYIGNRFANFWIAWGAGLPIEDSQCGFRLYPAAVLRAVLPRVGRSQGFVFESEVLIEAGQNGFPVVPVRIAAIYDPAIRPSNYRAWRDTWRITKMVAGKLVRRGLYLPGLFRSLVPMHRLRQRTQVFGRHGAMSFVAANSLIVATFGLSYAWALRHVWRLARAASIDADAIEFILVPGHRLDVAGPSADHVARLERARVLHRAHPAAKIVLLGRGVLGARETEAEAGARYLREQGIPDVALVTETQSRNTWENLLQARRLLAAHGNGASVIVTNRYHLARVSLFAGLARLPTGCCAAEEHLCFNSQTARKLAFEAYYVHWAFIGDLLFPSAVRGQTAAR
jgi:glycosyltransferase involved in cell wall biosynthesis